MGREKRRPVNVGDAKHRLREVARGDAVRAAASGAVVSSGLVNAARRRPFTSIAIAAAAGFAFGASRRVRSTVLTTLLRMVR